MCKNCFSLAHHCTSLVILLEFRESRAAQQKCALTEHANFTVSLIGRRSDWEGVYEIEKVVGRDRDNLKALTGVKVDSGQVFDQYFGTNKRQIVFPKNSANPVYYWPPA